MKNVWAMYRRELSSYFTSWIAYVVLSLFLAGFPGLLVYIILAFVMPDI